MGWNKQSTGKVYDSLSGHGFVIGCLTRKVIGYGVRKKKCSICNKLNNNNTAATEAHLQVCNVNSFGSSGAMESELALVLTEEVHNESDGHVYVGNFVSDDNSSMRCHLQHQSSDPKGKLSNNIPEPKFCADPSHCIKVMSAPIFKMVTKTKDPNKCKQVDALRIKKYTGCCIYKNRNLPISEFVANAKAPIEHLFNDHQWCHANWCWAKGLDNKTHELISATATPATAVAPSPHLLLLLVVTGSHCRQPPRLLVPLYYCVNLAMIPKQQQQQHLPPPTRCYCCWWGWGLNVIHHRGH